MRIGEALRITGSIGRNSKMPGTSYGLPATACKTGARLAAMEGTVCSACYALKGNYRRGAVVKAQIRRLRAISHPMWTDAMVTILDHLHSKPIRVDLGEVGVRLQRAGGERVRIVESGWHRWHDSGDLQSVEHLTAICEIAARLPWVRFWMPTNELGILRTWRSRHGELPENLIARVSSVLINGTAREWPTTSVVIQNGIAPPANTHLCPAPTQGHQCGSCRACWSPKVAHVAYAKH